MKLPDFKLVFFFHERGFDQAKQVKTKQDNEYSPNPTQPRLYRVGDIQQYGLQENTKNGKDGGES